MGDVCTKSGLLLSPLMMGHILQAMQSITYAKRIVDKVFRAATYQVLQK